MKARVYIIALVSLVSVLVNAQSTWTSPANDPAVQSHQIIKVGAMYQGTVYEPFDNSVPSDQSEVGKNTSPTKNSSIKKGFITPGEPGNQSDESPIGDGVWAMLFCALAFAGVVALRRRAAKE